MATEYGIRDDKGEIWGWDLEQAEWFCKLANSTLIAREVSEPRIVSIRA